VNSLLLPKFTLALNSVLLFWKLLIFEFLLSMSENILDSMSALQVKIVLFLDVFQVLMLFVRVLMYLEPKLFHLIILYSGTPIIIKVLIVFSMNVFFFSPHNGWYGCTN
jgi:hypothetical protein